MEAHEPHGESIFINEFQEEDEKSVALGSDCKVFVGNLPFRIDDRELKKLFSTCGEVIGINIRKDRVTGKEKV